MFRAKDLEEGCSSLNYALFIHCGSDLGYILGGGLERGLCHCISTFLNVPCFPKTRCFLNY